VKVGKRKDKIIKSHFCHTDTLVFERETGKNIFWTLEGLFPIFFAEMHFRFEVEFNFYEIWLNLPGVCFEVTEAKGWAEGIQKFTIANSEKLLTKDQKVEYTRE